MEFKKHDYIINATTATNSQLKKVLTNLKLQMIGRLIELPKYSFLPTQVQNIILITDHMNDEESRYIAQKLYNSKRFTELTHISIQYKFKNIYDIYRDDETKGVNNIRLNRLNNIEIMKERGESTNINNILIGGYNNSQTMDIIGLYVNSMGYKNNHKVDIQKSRKETKKFVKRTIEEAKMMEKSEVITTFEEGDVNKGEYKPIDERLEKLEDILFKGNKDTKVRAMTLIKIFLINRDHEMEIPFLELEKIRRGLISELE